jgi:hypothetical protein
MSTENTGLILWKAAVDTRAEATVCGWHAVIKQVFPTRNWLAYVELARGSTRLYSSEMFVEQQDAELWCRHEIGRHCELVRLAYGLERPKLLPQLQRKIFKTLCRYDTLTTQLLVAETLRAWGLKRAHIMLASEDYRDWPEQWLWEEPGHFFWFVLNKMDYSSASNRLSPGPITLDYAQVRQHADRWSDQLVQMPFYQTIYTYCMAVSDWVQTADLQPFVGRGKSKQDGIRACLNKWRTALDVY